MLLYAINRLSGAHNEHDKPTKGSKIGILGMAYKRDVDDHRESPPLKLMEILLEREAVVSYRDAHVPSVKQKRHCELAATQIQPATLEA